MGKKNGSDDLYHAVSNHRCSSSAEVKLGHLDNSTAIPTPAYSPLFPSDFTLAPDPLPPGCYVKKPRLTSYDQVCKGPEPDGIAQSVLQEAAVCELLKQHPHPNIASYLGCQVSAGRITGLCFAAYPHTLMQEVNPQNHMKRKARSEFQDRNEDRKDYRIALAGVERGLKHLHSLGLVHNDINPRKIMLDADDGVITGFRSCRRLGESLNGVSRGHEWHDEQVKTALPQNDLDALEEIRRWLGDDSKPFQFAE